MKKESVDRILMIIKMRGEATLALIASELSITKEGARQHLNGLIQSELVISEQRSEGVGRPTIYYSLTDKGFSRFPDTHAQVTVDLLQAVKSLLGDDALNLLISDREQQTYSRYAEALTGLDTIESRLDKLSLLRSQEGYMAEWKKEEDLYYFIESHCPICAAATACQGFCRAELQNFIKLFGPAYEIKRLEHILAKDRRCVYEIKELPKATQ